MSVTNVSIFITNIHVKPKAEAERSDQFLTDILPKRFLCTGRFLSTTISYLRVWFSFKYFIIFFLIWENHPFLSLKRFDLSPSVSLLLTWTRPKYSNDSHFFYFKRLNYDLLTCWRSNWTKIFSINYTV